MQSTISATISLGKPITAPALITVAHSSTPNCIDEPFMMDRKPYKFTCVSFGTPHCAVFVDNVDDVDVPALGAKLGTHALFPKGASIVFIQMLDKDSLKARLWQRGKGEATFTPEAACVAGTAAMMLQRVSGYKANVSMDDNTFQVRWDRGGGDVSLTGAAGLVRA